jgi:hypothetical protein
MDGCGAPIIIADGIDGKNFVEVEINKKHFKKAKIAADIFNANAMIVLSHAKGHCLAGFGGALKNLGMGCAARIGKFEMHCSAKPEFNTQFCIGCGLCVGHCPGFALSLKDSKISFDINKCIGCGECIHHCPKRVFDVDWTESASVVCERFVEYAYGAIQNKPIFYFNSLTFITKECDCLSHEEKGLIPDIGLLASKDPVAIDQASLDLINKTAGYDLFKKLHPNTEPEHQLVYAEKIGLGSRDYNLETI